MDRRSFLLTAALSGFGGSTAPDWAALGRGLDGRLVRPGQAGYDAARRLYNPTFDPIRPRGVRLLRHPAGRGGVPGLRPRRARAP
ncbi:hypothetical protein [Nonomuraea dietziae]|uniref:hypothetical protein n=1 Tax=Nonomuraea dietziae TaxID=65515 RepID=UPI0031E155C7